MASSVCVLDLDPSVARPLVEILGAGGQPLPAYSCSSVLAHKICSYGKRIRNFPEKVEMAGNPSLDLAAPGCALC